MVAAMALLAATAGSAAAAAYPGCTARIAPPATGTTASCSFDSPTDWSTITVAPVGTVTVTTRCTTYWGYTVTKSRTVSAATYWATSTVGSCTLTIAAVSAGASGNASATPAIGPIS
jgi:hypothetical protein